VAATEYYANGTHHNGMDIMM